MNTTTLHRAVGYGERLEVAISEAGFTVKQVADHLGVTTQAIYKVTRGQTKALQVGHHLRAAKFLSVEPVWLSDGLGSRHLAGPIALRGNPEYPSIEMVTLTIISGKPGYTISPIEEVNESPIVFHAGWFKRNCYDPERMVGIRVRDAAMAPTLAEGDQVVLNLSDVEAKDGEVYAIKCDDRIVLRRLFRTGGTWMQHCDNADDRRHPRMPLSPASEVIGRVVHRQSDRV